MADITTIENDALTITNGVIGAFFQGGEVAAEAYLTALDPSLLALPIVAWFLDEGVALLGKFLRVATEKFADSVVIDIQINGEKSKALNACTELALALGSGNTDAIAQASQDAKDAYKAVVHFDGFGNPS